jgi:predicted kinase
MNKKVIFLCGIPASGKSTWVREESNRLSPSSIVISRDAIRREYKEALREEDVNRVFNVRVKKAMEDPSITYVFIDNTNVRQHYILQIMDKCLEYNENCDFFIKVFDVPFEECLDRNEKRVGVERVPIDVMERMRRKFENFKNNLKSFCYNNCIEIV